MALASWHAKRFDKSARNHGKIVRLKCCPSRVTLESSTSFLIINTKMANFVASTSPADSERKQAASKTSRCCGLLLVRGKPVLHSFSADARTYLSLHASGQAHRVVAPARLIAASEERREKVVYIPEKKSAVLRER